MRPPVETISVPVKEVPFGPSLSNFESFIEQKFPQQGNVQIINFSRGPIDYSGREYYTVHYQIWRKDTVYDQPTNKVYIFKAFLTSNAECITEIYGEAKAQHGEMDIELYTLSEETLKKALELAIKQLKNTRYLPTGETEFPGSVVSSTSVEKMTKLNNTIRTALEETLADWSPDSSLRIYRELEFDHFVKLVSKDLH